MAEYIDREAVITRLQKVCVTDDTFGMGVQTGTDHAINCIKEAPAADVVEVVRCKECGSYNKYFCECTRYGAHLGENGYCSNGKRKGGENNV